MVKNSFKMRPNLWRVVYVALFALVVIVVLSNFKSFNSSLSDLRHARPLQLIGVVALVAMSYIFASLNYYFLALYKLKYSNTLRVEIAGNFINRLLPAGIGGMSVNYNYLKKQGHNSPEAVTVVGLNNVIGYFVHFLILLLILSFIPLNSSVKLINFSRSDQVISLVVVAVIVLGLLGWPKLRRRIADYFKKLKSYLKFYRRRKFKIPSTMLSAVGITASNVLALYLSLYAVHTHLGLASVMVAFTLGISLGAVVPTPGGLGGVEAGIVTALVAFHLTLTKSVAAVLIFRLVSFWLAMIIGAFFLIICRRRKLL